jgi:RimJ/RimL family protein N-acetyltransferase
MKQAVLETARLRLEPFGEQHLSERYVAWLSDPDVVRWSERRLTPHTLESCRAYYESFRGTLNAFFAIVARDPAVGHIGNITVHRDELAARHGVADVGILLGERAAWGMGYGREAWGRVVQALLAEPEIRKVTGGCVSENHAMIKVMQACGMKKDGRRERHMIYEGRAVDVLHYAVWKEEQ